MLYKGVPLLKRDEAIKIQSMIKTVYKGQKRSLIQWTFEQTRLL